MTPLSSPDGRYVVCTRYHGRTPRPPRGPGTWPMAMTSCSLTKKRVSTNTLPGPGQHAGFAVDANRCLSTPEPSLKSVSISLRSEPMPCSLRKTYRLHGLPYCPLVAPQQPRELVVIEINESEAMAACQFENAGHRRALPQRTRCPIT